MIPLTLGQAWDSKQLTERLIKERLPELGESSPLIIQYRKDLRELNTVNFYEFERKEAAK